MRDTSGRGLPVKYYGPGGGQPGDSGLLGCRTEFVAAAAAVSCGSLKERKDIRVSNDAVHTTPFIRRRCPSLQGDDSDSLKSVARSLSDS